MKKTRKIGIGTALGNIFAERFYTTPDPRKRKSSVVLEVRSQRITFEELIQIYTKAGGIRVPAPVPRI